MRSRAVLAGVLLAGAAFGAAPAQAVCNLALYELTGWCSPCDPVGIAYEPVRRQLDHVLPPLYCAD